MVYVSKSKKMSATGLLLLRSFILILIILVFNTNGQVNPVPSQVGVHRRFEYKYSFKPPYLAQKDGTVPFWEYGGSKYTTLITTKNKRILTTCRHVREKALVSGNNGTFYKSKREGLKKKIENMLTEWQNAIIL